MNRQERLIEWTPWVIVTTALVSFACSSGSSTNGNQNGQNSAGSGGLGNAGGAGAGGFTGAKGGSFGNGGVLATGGFVGAGNAFGNGGAVGIAGAPGMGGVPGSAGALGTGGLLGSGGSAGSAGAGAAPGAGGMAQGAGGAMQTGPGCLKGTGDFSKAGPYMVTTKSVDLASALSGASSPTTFTIFYPTTLDSSCPAPLISWGNGTGVTGSSVYAFFNNNAASWGMVVIASDNSNVAGSPFLAAGIDYMLAQNKDSSSPFFGKLSGRVGTSGHSQGAIAATTATTHAAVTSEVQVEGGGVPKKGISFLALSGTADNVVTTGPPTQSYGAATGPSMLAIYTGADHVTTPTLAGYIQGNAGSIQFMRFYTAWFRCFLGDDMNACAMFKGGQSCGVCKDPNWDMIQTKNM